MQAHIQPFSTILNPGLGSKGQNSTFSEHGHVAYQIKGNDECSKMQAHILSFHIPSTPGVGSKHIFLKEVILQIIFMGMEHRAPCKHIFCPYTHPQPLGLDQKVKTYFFFFLKVVILHIELNGMEHKAPCKHILCPYTHPQPPDGV